MVVAAVLVFVLVVRNRYGGAAGHRVHSPHDRRAGAAPADPGAEDPGPVNADGALPIAPDPSSPEAGTDMGVPVGTISGWIVLGDDGSPEGIRVRLETMPEREAIADEAGRFAFEGVAAGIYMIGASQAGYSPQEARVVLTDDTGAIAALHLEPLSVLVLRVEDSTGRPVPGRRVIVRRILRGASPTVADGRTNETGEVTLRADPDAYVVEFEGIPKRWLILAPGRHVTVRYVVDAFLEGVVLDPAGRPLPEASVLVHPTVDGDPLLPLRAITDDWGRYRFEGLPAGTYGLAVIADRAGSVRLDQGSVTVDPTRNPICDIAIDGSLVTGRTSPQAAVEALHGSRIYRAVADDNGWYALVGLPPAEYKLRARSQDGSVLAEREIRLGAGGHLPDADLLPRR